MKNYENDRAEPIVRHSQRVSRSGPLDGVDAAHLARWADPGLSLVGPGPSVRGEWFWASRSSGSLGGDRWNPTYTTGSGTPDGVFNLGTAGRMALRRTSRATASNLDTLLDRGVGRRVRMLLSFQRPSHLFWKGFLPSGASRGRVPLLERTGEYSARATHLEALPPGIESSNSSGGMVAEKAGWASPRSRGGGHRGGGAQVAEEADGGRRGSRAEVAERLALTTPPGPSPSASAAGRRSRAGRSAARSPAAGGRRRSGRFRRGR